MTIALRKKHMDLVLMSDVMFCDKGTHEWYDADIAELKNKGKFYVLVACKKCSSKFLKELTP